MIHVGCLVALREGNGNTGEVTIIDWGVATVYWGVSGGRESRSTHPLTDLRVVATADEVIAYRAIQSVMLVG